MCIIENIPYFKCTPLLLKDKSFGSIFVFIQLECIWASNLVIYRKEAILKIKNTFY